jgi:uncharacterized protein YndB with AHSA1/START domain
MSENEIRRTIEIDAPPEVVFKAISDPEELTNWFPDTAVLEPRVGGKFEIAFLKDSKNPRMKMEMDFFNEGRVVEFVQNKKLAYTWQWTGMTGFPETVVTWELEQLSNNKTRLILTHSGFTGKEEGPASINEHIKGWSFFLNELVTYCKK